MSNAAHATWTPADVTADDARVLRAEDREAASRGPVAARRHVALVAPYVPVKRLSWGHKIMRAIARVVAWLGIAGLIVVALWAFVVLVAS